MNASTTPRLLIVPGLRNSGPGHWQTWLEDQHPDAVRVQQDWHVPDLVQWTRQIGDTLSREPPGAWIVAAHSFGCLATAHFLTLLANARAPRRSTIRAALLVAPANPERFGVVDQLPIAPLRVPTTVVASETDPWMRLSTAQTWAVIWGARFRNLGDAGHINVDSGHGAFPDAQAFVREHLPRSRDDHYASLPFAMGT